VGVSVGASVGVVNANDCNVKSKDWIGISFIVRGRDWS
jgi:hypothetical protein